MTSRRIKEWSIALAILLAIGAGVVALQRYNERVAAELARDKFVPKPATITPEVLLLRDYVRIDTSNPPGKEAAGARWLANELRKGGVQPELIESAPGRLNVYARLEGTRPGEGLLLLHHIDVVPADPKQWQHPPFAGEMQFNMMHGRGTLDMKGIAICHLRAFLDVARSGKRPLRDIIYLGVADEETGSEHGMLWLLHNRPDLFQGVRYALNEGGITETKENEISYFGIEVATKQIIAATLSAPSRDSLRRARIALEPYFASTEPERISPEVRRFFQYLAPRRLENPWLLAEVDRAVAEGRFWNLPAGYRELTQNIVWAEGVKRTTRTKDCGLRTESLRVTQTQSSVLSPQSCYEMQTFLLNLPDEDPDQRLAWLERQVSPYGVRVDVKRRDPKIPISSEFTPLFALLEREIAREYGPVPVGTEILNNAQNDSRFLRPLGITCYGVWPFPVDYLSTKGIHGVNERIRLDWFAQGVELTQRVVSAYAFEPGDWN